MNVESVESSKLSKMNGLRAILLSLILGALAVVLLLSTLGTVAIGLPYQEENMLKNPERGSAVSAAASTTVNVSITKTVVPTRPDTGGVVSICFTVKRLELDVVLTQDVSWSMGETITTSQVAAKSFINQLQSTDRAAVVAYSSTVSLVQPLTTNTTTLKAAVDGLTTGGRTSMGESISVAHKELITSPRHMTDTVKAIILLSDGEANVSPISGITPTLYAKQRAQAAASDSIKIYTIGFGRHCDEDLLQEIAKIGHGEFFSTPNPSDLVAVYLTIAVKLHTLIITDILPSEVVASCPERPPGCNDISGTNAIAWSIANSSLMSNPSTFCFTATVNLDANYEGPINEEGSGFCYQAPNEQPECPLPFDNPTPTITVGGRKITGLVFYDLDNDGTKGSDEQGAPGIVLQTSTGLTISTSVSGIYVLRTSSEPALSITVASPLFCITTRPISENIPAVTGNYSVDFGICRALYLPVIMKDYPVPIVSNGGFEDGWTGWLHEGELEQSISPDHSHWGRFSALLGNPAYDCNNGVPVGSAWIEQTVSVPDKTSPKLVFWYNIFTQDRNRALVDTYDRFEASISGTSVFSDANRNGPYGCNQSEEQADLGWRVAEIDLNAYRNQTVTIRFENWNQPGGWFNTWTYVDDVWVTP